MQTEVLELNDLLVEIKEINKTEVKDAEVSVISNDQCSIDYTNDDGKGDRCGIDYGK